MKRWAKLGQLSDLFPDSDTVQTKMVSNFYYKRNFLTSFFDYLIV